jgi:hypothetical protein
VAAVIVLVLTNVDESGLGIPPTAAPSIDTIAPVLKLLPVIVIVLLEFSLIVPDIFVIVGGASTDCQPNALYCSIRPKSVLYLKVPTATPGSLSAVVPLGTTIPPVPPITVLTYLYLE